MKYADSNAATATGITVTNVTEELSAVSTLVDRRTTRSYVADQDGASDVEITIDVDTGTEIELVALANIIGISGTITVKLYTGAVEQASDTMTVAAIVEQTYASVTFDSVACDEVEITFNVGGGAEFSIGYLYAGSLSDALTVADAAINMRIVSTDPVVITRAGTPVTSDDFRYVETRFAIVEKTATALRTQLVELMTTIGRGVPTFWYFDESCLFTGEVLYAVLDGDAAQLDLVWHKDATRATTTLTLREVY